MTITFRATSNNVQPSKQLDEFQASASPVNDVISNHEGFRNAFGSSGNVSKSVRIIQSSAQNESVEKMISPRNNHGFVDCVIHAYNHHFDLVLRPDDVWQAILTQFSFYVNAHGEELRNCFVDFQGKRELEIVTGGALFTVDFGGLANRMVDEQIKHNIKDAQVTDWLLPCFTTTTEKDRIVASVSIMSTLQTFFSYKFSLRCGIPNVTLEGTPEDWRELRAKLDKLTDYELQQDKALNDSRLPYMAQWCEFLVPIVDELVASSKGNVNLEFWDTVCSHHGGGSGPTYLSGWITAFCCFSSGGKWQVPWTCQEDNKNTKKGRVWPKLDTDNIPPGVVSVPVTVDDNGTLYKTQMVAGQFGYECKNSSVQPRSDWCIAYDQSTDQLTKVKVIHT